MDKKIFILGFVFILLCSIASADNLDYWRQDDSDTDVWINVEIPISTTKGFLIYNSTSYSQNGTNVFQLFEDCNDNNFDTAQWKNNLGGAVVPDSYANGICNLSGNNSIITSLQTTDGISSVLETRFKTTLDAATLSIGFRGSSPNRYVIIDDPNRYTFRDDSEAPIGAEKHVARTSSVDSFRRWKFTGSASAYSIYADDVLQYTETDTGYIPADFSGVKIQVWAYNTADPLFVDYILTRKKGTDPSIIKSCTSDTCLVNLTSSTSLVDYQYALDSFDLSNDLTITDSFVTLTMEDSYTGDSITSFSVDYNGQEYYTSTGEILLDCQSSFINATFFNASGNVYYNSTETTIDCINDHYYTGSSVQSYVTFNFIDERFNTSITSSIQAQDITSGVDDSTTTGSITMNPVNGANTFQFNSNSYTTEMISFTLSNPQNATYQINMSPALILNFYDELTLQPFDFTPYNDTKFEVFCTDKTEEFPVTSFNNTFNVSCNFFKLKMTLTLNDDEYYRSLLFDEDFNYNNASMYLIDLENTTALFNTFILYDIFNDFENKQLLIQKITDIGVINIHSDFADVRDTVGAFLIPLNEYIFTVRSSNKVDKFFGVYVADTAGDFTMRLFDLDFSSSQIYTQTGVAYTTLNDNGIIRSFYNDTTIQGVVNSGTFTVRNGSSTGTLLYTATSTASGANFAYIIPALYTNETLYTVLDIDVSEGTDIQHILLILDETEINQPSTFDTPDFLKWVLFLVLVAFALTATITSQSVVSLLLVALGGFLNYIGWLMIGYPVLSVGVLLSLITLFMGDDK